MGRRRFGSGCWTWSGPVSARRDVVFGLRLIFLPFLASLLFLVG